jgi:hypothetical protein
MAASTALGARTPIVKPPVSNAPQMAKNFFIS